MNDNTIYVAGGLYCIDPARPESKFGLVHAGHGDDRPYLTRNRNGLQLTRHHAHLYALTPDLSTAVLVDYREGIGQNRAFKLTPEQTALVRKSIETNYFFD